MTSRPPPRFTRVRLMSAIGLALAGPSACASEEPEASNLPAALSAGQSNQCVGITNLTGFVIGSDAAGRAGPDEVTDRVQSGRGEAQLTLGVTDLGGGYINEVRVAGIAGGIDLSGPDSSLYGRGGQASLRDELRSGNFNPNQAGPNRYAGTIRPIHLVDGVDFGLDLPRRPVALMGPGGEDGYDYIKFEDLFADDYPDDGGSRTAPGSDDDNFADTPSAGQAGEVTSPFDYSGSYRNCAGVDLGGPVGPDVSISCIRHQYAFAFVRPGGANMAQFGPGSPVWNAEHGAHDISVANPAGVHPSSAHTLAELTRAWSIRLDTRRWRPAFRFTLDATGALVAAARTEPRPSGGTRDLFYAQVTSFDPASNDRLMTPVDVPPPPVAGSLVVLADAATVDAGVALGFYFPLRGANHRAVAGRTCDGRLAYLDNRNIVSTISDNPGRAEGDLMTLVAHKTVLTGLLSPAESNPGQYEEVRGEVFILAGTPSQIARAARAIEAAL